MLHYIFSEDDALVGIYVVREKPWGVLDEFNVNGHWVYMDGYIQDTMYYVHQDRLGSYAVITDDTGQVKQRLGYDVWGNRVLDTNWSVRAEFDNGDFDYIFRRGFTGHEHLGSFGIINMNGRIYDPNIASFFSPDPYVVDATSTQAFNRYSYCLNNPLIYTDPSGEYIHIIIGAIIGGINGWQLGEATGAKGWKMAGYIFAGAAIGGASAGVGSYVSSAISTTATTGLGTAAGIAAGGATSGAISGAGFTALAGGNIGQIFKSAGIGALSGAVGSYLGTYIGGDGGAFIGGGVSSGLNALMNGASGEDILYSALIGGSAAFLSYNVTQYYNWHQSGSDLTFNQFKEMSAAAQKSFISDREFGGWLTKNGGVDMGLPGKRTSVSLPYRDASTIAGEFHTHCDGTEGFSYGFPDSDFTNLHKQFATGKFDLNSYNAYVICRQNVWQLNTTYPLYHNIAYPTSYHNPYFISSYMYFLNLGR